MRLNLEWAIMQGMKTTLNIAGERVTVTAFGDEACVAFGDASVAPNAVEPCVPFIYMHEIQDESDAVLKRCAELGCPPFVLVAIHVPQWSNMLTPWECPGIFADDAPFAGHAKRQLEALSEIVQKTEAQLGGHPVHRCIAGYSLAGLFATWAPFQTDLFDAVASASGSMWYPNFAEYVETGEFERPLRCAYFSLGSTEARTPSRLLRGVADGTQRVVAAFEAKGVKTVFESNPGNHFKEPDVRMAKAICWAVSNCGENSPSNSKACELRRE